jgi:hypothetical protein
VVEGEATVSTTVVNARTVKNAIPNVNYVYIGRPWRNPATGIGWGGYPMRNVVRVDRSPMNPKRVLVFQLECGHDVGQPVTRGPRPKILACSQCPRKVTT